MQFFGFAMSLFEYAYTDDKSITVNNNSNSGVEEREGPSYQLLNIHMPTAGASVVAIVAVIAAAFLVYLGCCRRKESRARGGGRRPLPPVLLLLRELLSP